MVKYGDWKIMRPHLKSIFYTCLKVLAPLCGLAMTSLQVAAAEPQEATDQTSWRMTWVEDFGTTLTWDENYEATQLPHKDWAPHLENYIRTVKIQTSMIDGKFSTVSASAGCNGIGRDIRRRVVTPAKTIETIRDGQAHYETTPAVFENYDEWFTTQKGCTWGQEIDGKKYGFNWISLMERFLLKNAPNATLSRKANSLEWIGPSGTAIARFEKLPDVLMHQNYWEIDPNFHDDDPVLARYLGPGKISISFPKISFYRACSRLFSKVDATDIGFEISNEVSVYPCEDISYLLNGQRLAYTTNNTAPENLLARHLPEVARYTIAEEGETQRLTLSDKDGKSLVHLISSDVRPLNSQQNELRIYDTLDDHEWIMEPTANLSADVIRTLNPVRIFRHHANIKEGPKTKATLISGQDCALRGFGVTGRNQSMAVYRPRSLKTYNECESAEASALKTEWAKARRMLFDDNTLVFYDENWTEVMKARRGQPLETLEE